MSFKIRPIYIALLVLAVAVLSQAPWESSQLLAQSNLRVPVVASNASYTALSIKWTAGTLNNGGHAVTVTAGSGALTASKSDCSAPGYAGCNFVYANSSGTVAVTTTRYTATASGNTLMAYVETSGSAITKISLPQQASIASTDGILLTDCVSSLTCATPTTTYGLSVRVFIGTAAFTAGTTTVSGLSPAFASASSYGCTADYTSGTSTGTGPILFTPVSSSSFTLASNAGGTQNVRYICFGY